VTAQALHGLLVLAQDGWDSGHMDLDDGWWIVMMVGMFIFWALVIVGAVWAIRYFTADRGRRDGPDALELLDRRLAEGAISVEEYQERRRVLSGEPPPPEGAG
jgi:putative membrane protein